MQLSRISSVIDYSFYLKNDKAKEDSDFQDDDFSKVAKSPKNNKTQEKDQKEKLIELKRRDKEVEMHEMAHVAAGGAYVRGTPNYSYTLGPDGIQYKVSGHVNIDTKEEKDPKKTIAKAQTIYRAALAPANPSSQDRAVAQEAKIMEQNAIRKLNKKNSLHANLYKLKNSYLKQQYLEASFNQSSISYVA